MELGTLAQYAEICYNANFMCQGFPSLEIGTCRGGSALAFLKAIRLVNRTDPPMLFTVDPYGEKPYSPSPIDGADYKYGDNDYLTAKRELSIYPNHAHFLLTGRQFIDHVVGLSYWKNGKESTIDNFAFAFLDGQHDANTVVGEAWALSKHMQRGGTILIDNINWERDIIPELEPLGNVKKLSARTAICQF